MAENGLGHEEFAEALTDAVVALERCDEGAKEAFAAAFGEAIGAYADAMLTKEEAETVEKLLDAGDCEDRTAFLRVMEEWCFDESGNLVVDPSRDDTLKTLIAAHLVYEALETAGQLGEGDGFALKVWLNNDRDKVDLVAKKGRYVIMGATVGNRTIPPETVDWLNRHPDICALERPEELLFFAQTLQSAAARMEGAGLWRFLLEFIQNVCGRYAARQERRGRITHVPVLREKGGDAWLEPAPVMADGMEEGRVVLKEVEVTKSDGAAEAVTPMALAKEVEEAAEALVAWAEESASEKADEILEDFLDLLREYSEADLSVGRIDAFVGRANRHVESLGAVRAVAAFLGHVREQFSGRWLRLDPLHNLAMFHAGLMASSLAPRGGREPTPVKVWLDDNRDHVLFLHFPESGRLCWRGATIDDYVRPEPFDAYVEENLPFFEMEGGEVYGRYIPWLNERRARLNDRELCLAVYEDIVARCRDTIRRLSRWHRLEDGRLAFEGGATVAMPLEPSCGEGAKIPEIPVVMARKRVVDGKLVLEPEEAAVAGS